MAMVKFTFLIEQVRKNYRAISYIFPTELVLSIYQLFLWTDFITVGHNSISEFQVHWG